MTHGNKIALLAVSDDPNLLERVKRELGAAEGRQFEILACAHAEAGRIVLSQRRIDVALVNCRAKPETLLEGIKCLRKADHFAGAVIALPSQGDEDLAVAALKAGAADYINLDRLQRGRLVSAIARACEEAAHAGEIAQRRKDLEKYARFDELTGLYNAHALRDALLQEMWRAKRYSDPLSLLLIDIDGLDGVRETQGAIQGDIVLSGLGALIKQNTRGTDISGRHATADFCLILTGTDAKGAKIFAQRLRKTLSQAVFSDPQGHEFSLTCSVGIAQFDDSLGDSVSFFTLADQALFRARKSGGNKALLAGFSKTKKRKRK